ncbi:MULTISPECIES: 1-aminocyclopropane-1-carboxylate deaminase/D-cysteine desulfhydrase [Maribacter]|uniref:Pyridoxal-phosphate dependent enzyme n=1 Tax=Maribacter flavus TaxID=1658664 RepID=A0ABU7IGP8_9FLAO|nr:MULTISPECIES: pyridoxal-phosphate dependent enzyme [Maribacter]MDC6405167.1 pyridoxal-phosphate dependent enzyme [Maribacter sp. PR66]MEE1972026.1 pyridoxal-phosphate dependent enzyme [Maribacter flavus]
MQVENQYVELPILREKQVVLAIKREDLIHSFISGNKFRKLKYNILKAQESGHTKIVTFGGAFSNHIAATSAAAKIANLEAIGIIRGEELLHTWLENPTLKRAHENGMRFKFVSREIYRQRNDPEFLISLRNEFGDFYLIPEGGTNDLAIKGCEEILHPLDTVFDFISVCVGTGGTMAGLINASGNNQQVLGFPVLKGDFLSAEIKKLSGKENWSLNQKYHFGGYAKINEELVHFINRFKQQTGIPLDPVYTGKMMYGLLDMVRNDNFAPGTRILAIHTGGLQGIFGMNLVLRKKNLPLLDI